MMLTVLEPIARESEPNSSLGRKMDSIADYYKQPLENLRVFTSNQTFLEKSTTEPCVSVPEILMQTFDQVYEPMNNSGEDDRQRSEFVFGWLYRLPDKFTRLLRGKYPTALIILAHFTVLLREFGSYWFMDSWVDHFMAGIGEEHQKVVSVACRTNTNQCKLARRQGYMTSSSRYSRRKIPKAQRGLRSRAFNGHPASRGV